MDEIRCVGSRSRIHRGNLKEKGRDKKTLEIKRTQNPE